jgi:hypothetical protein
VAGAAYARLCKWAPVAYGMGAGAQGTREMGIMEGGGHNAGMGDGGE